MLVYIFIECYFAFLSTSSKVIDKIQKACAHTYIYESLKKSYHSFVTRFDNDLSILRTSLFISFFVAMMSRIESSLLSSTCTARESQCIYKLKNKWMNGTYNKIHVLIAVKFAAFNFHKDLSFSFVI